MYAILFYLFLAALAGWYISRWHKTRDAKNLQSAGSLVFAITFFVCLGLAIDEVLYQAGSWKGTAALLAGSAVGGLLLSAGYAGWRKVYAAGQALLFMAVTAFFGNSMWYFEKVLVVPYAEQAISKIYPETAGQAMNAFNSRQKADLAARLAVTLAETKDPLLRLGALRKLSYCGPEAAAALPAMIDRIDKADSRELDLLLTVFRAMGPAAAPAAAALSECAWDGGKPCREAKIEETIKIISPPPPNPAPLTI